MKKREKEKREKEKLGEKRKSESEELKIVKWFREIAKSRMLGPSH